MFSGIVECVGWIEDAKPRGAARRLTVRSEWAPPPAQGASVAVNGVCLTVEQCRGSAFELTAVEETLRLTNLGALGSGSRVNLERALRVGDPLGGHWVQGHVDAVGRIAWVRPGEGGSRIGVEIPERLNPFLATKGSIAIDGVSLTVAKWSAPIAEIALIPYTLECTIAGTYGAGDVVNVEADLLARYIVGWAEARGFDPARVLTRAAEAGS